MKPKKFKNIPVEIEAMQFTEKTKNDIKKWCGDKISIVYSSLFKRIIVAYLKNSEDVELQTEVNDWIIKDANGKFYPCKPDVFAKTYIEVK